MLWKSGGKERKVNVTPYLINWDGKAPSKGAQAVKDFLKRNVRTHVWLEEFRIPRTLLRVDFLSVTGKFAIEFNGRQHEEYVEHFHRNRIGYHGSIKRDVKKMDALEENGYTLVIVEENDLPLTKKWFQDNYQIQI